MSEGAQSYTFESYSVRLPLYVGILMPLPIREQLREARDAASAAFQELRVLESTWEDRLHHLCGKEDEAVFEDHVTSVETLLDWRPVYRATNGTLTTAPKMPKTMFRFHIDEDAYNDYVWEYETTRKEYLNGSYAEWFDTKLTFELALAGCPEISPGDKKIVEEWWDGFVGEMQNWVVRIDDLIVPEFDDAMAELMKLVDERIDVQGEWDFIC